MRKVKIKNSDAWLSNEEFGKIYGRTKNIGAITLGCKVNQYETEAMIESFENNKYNIVEYNEFAEIYIINTCTVTNIGDRKSRQIIRRALDINPDAFIAVVGCYSQIAPQKVMDMEGVSLVVGTSERANIVKLVEDTIAKNQKTNRVKDIMDIKEFEEMSVKGYKNKTRAFVKIQEGCEQYCTYCIIPYARGHIRSRKLNSILEEVNGLANNGFKEIVLTGIHVASYGKDLKDVDLLDVIEEVHKCVDIERIRMSSIEPNIITDDFIKKLKKLPKVCRHFHLSLQSGCNETLRRMNRKYTTEEYANVVKNLRQAFSDVAITTDLIVGFPGETKEEFEKTKSFVEQIKFSSIHIFKFSPREGTPAARFENQINPQIKEERSKIINKIALKNEEMYRTQFIGKYMKILYEQNYGKDKNYYEGLTDNYLKVIAKSNEDIRGKILDTILKKAEKDCIKGTIVK